MTFFKVISGLLYASFFVICHGQFLTPEQLREQYELSYGVRTHYEPSGSRRTDLFNRANPDYLLDGFFPFWSIVLIGISFIFLIMALLGLIGYFLGCRRPSLEEIYANEFDQLTPDEEFLLGAQGFSHLNETKISIPTPTHEYFSRSHRHNSTYESLIPEERTRPINAREHMV